MDSHILTPEWRPYIVAIVIVFAVSSMSLAAKRRIVGPPAVMYAALLQTHVALMLGIVILGTAVVGVPAFMPSTFLAGVALTGAGVGAGTLAAGANGLIVHNVASVTRPSIAYRGAGHRRQRATQLLLLVATGILEEVLFRGYLVTFAFWLPGRTLVATALAMSVLCFAVVHIYGGLEEALGKLPLGALTLVLALGSGLLWPAIVAHLCFNLMASPVPVAERAASY